MGEAAEEIKFSAYVIGPDYMSQRDRLREVLTGDGVLMHPTAGAMRVYVAGKYSVREAPTAEGGMARFDLVFVRAEARRYPAAVANTQADVVRAAAVAKLAAGDAFAAGWKLKEKPGWVAEQAVARIDTTLGKVWGAMGPAMGGLGDFTSQATAKYRVLRSGLATLVSSPRGLADAVVALYALPADLSSAQARLLQKAFAWGFNLAVRMPRTAFEVSVVPAPGAGLVMYGTGKPDAIGTGSAGQAQIALLTDTSDRLFECLAAAAYVQATAFVEPASYDDAMAMRVTVHEQLMRLLAGASAARPATALPTTSQHDALLGLHTAALADLQARSRDLVRLTTYTPQSWQPIWYVSYRLYGTASYADEIRALNPHIRHPMLVPPGQALRVVKHD
jgi:prophage DNA circulation protein